MPKPSKKSSVRNYVKPSAIPSKEQIPNYSARKKAAKEALDKANRTIAKYTSPNVSSDCVYNKGFTGLKVGG
jgi:hypothetical protein